jgi:hypothetical protein
MGSRHGKDALPARTRDHRNGKMIDGHLHMPRYWWRGCIDV